MDLLIHSTHLSLYASNECEFNDLQMCLALLNLNIVMAANGGGITICLLILFCF